jgi:LAO/AO transport system kinase
MAARRTSPLTALQLEKGIIAGDRSVLARAITVAESHLPADQKKINSVLSRLLKRTGKSVRIGITGVPGVGKSTFIETFGELLTANGKKVGVLTVDPSSQKTKGSILGDKTRMDRLSKNDSVFIRPSPTNLALGGVTAHTREAILLCEAAGYDVILVETVGVGQSETQVRSMVDFFLLLMLAGAGDELQGIKKGIMEMADGIVITKADGYNEEAAKQAKADALQALHFQQTSASGWKTKVLTVSALEGKGIDEVWKSIQEFERHTISSGWFDENRRKQRLGWLDECLEIQFRQILNNPSVNKKKARLYKDVLSQKVLPVEAATLLFSEVMRRRK